MVAGIDVFLWLDATVVKRQALIRVRECRLKAIKVSGLRVSVAWKVPAPERLSGSSSSGWQQVEGGLPGRVWFEVQVLRPLPPRLASMPAGLSWHLVHESTCDFSTGSKDMLGNINFVCHFSEEELGKWSKEVEVRVRAASDADDDERSPAYSVWRALLLDVPPIPQAPHVEIDNVSVNSCSVNWKLPAASARADGAVFTLEVNTGNQEGSYRTMYRGHQLVCGLQGLEENTRISVRVCYETDESGQSQWRYKDVCTTMTAGSHQSAASKYIAKFLAALWQKTGSTWVLVTMTRERESAQRECRPKGLSSALRCLTAPRVELCPLTHEQLTRLATK